MFSDLNFVRVFFVSLEFSSINNKIESQYFEKKQKTHLIKNLAMLNKKESTFFNMFRKVFQTLYAKNNV